MIRSVREEDAEKARNLIASQPGGGDSADDDNATEEDSTVKSIGPVDADSGSLQAGEHIRSESRKSSEA